MAKSSTLNRKQIIGGVDQDMVNSHRLVKVQMQAEHATCIARVDLPEYGIKAGEQFELVQSSYVGWAYIITTDEQHNRICTCNGFMWRRDCKHVKLCSKQAAARYFAHKADSEHELVLEPAPSVPVAVRDVEGYTAHLIVGDAREVVRAHDLPVLFPNGYRLIEKSDPEWWTWMERLSKLPERKWDESDEAAHAVDDQRGDGRTGRKLVKANIRETARLGATEGFSLLA